jgi:hypothetical protein
MFKALKAKLQRHAPILFLVGLAIGYNPACRFINDWLDDTQKMIGRMENGESFLEALKPDRDSR